MYIQLSIVGLIALYFLYKIIRFTFAGTLLLLFAVVVIIIIVVVVVVIVVIVVVVGIINGLIFGINRCGSGNIIRASAA